VIITLDDYKDQVLPRVRAGGNHTDEASFLVALGNMYIAEGHRAKGLQQHQLAIRIHESFGEWTEAARVYATSAKM
jgi:hypothetical protein